MKRLNRLKKGFDENIDTEGSWAISYGDMITLLLSFFVLFYTVDPQAEKQQSMQDQIAAELEGLEKVNSTKANKNIMNLGKEAGESVQEMVIHKRKNCNSINRYFCKKWHQKKLLRRDRSGGQCSCRRISTKV